MRATAAKSADREEDPILDIASLIDVSFLLLIFFLVTSTLQRVETELGMTGNGIPNWNQPEIPLTIRIAIDDGGTVYVDGETVAPDLSDREMPTLRHHLAQSRELAALTGAEVMVILNANDGSQHQRLIDVMNALASNKLSRIAFEQ